MFVDEVIVSLLGLLNLLVSNFRYNTRVCDVRYTHELTDSSLEIILDSGSKHQSKIVKRRRFTYYLRPFGLWALSLLSLAYLFRNVQFFMMYCTFLTGS